MIFVMDPGYTCILLLYKDCATDKPKRIGEQRGKSIDSHQIIWKYIWEIGRSHHKNKFKGTDFIALQE
jgi:hypothetical protein